MSDLFHSLQHFNDCTWKIISNCGLEKIIWNQPSISNCWINFLTRVFMSNRKKSWARGFARRAEENWKIKFKMTANRSKHNWSLSDFSWSVTREEKKNCKAFDEIEFFFSLLLSSATSSSSIENDFSTKL